jgi:hypothetical protein
MKHLFALALFALPLLGSSQLPNGSVAPDFSITDIDGVEHHLYSYLDSGYAVIIDFCDVVRTVLELPHERCVRGYL